MAERYWVGGTATWDGTALLKWALTSGGVGGQAVPTAADNVYFDAASGANTVTLSGARTCLNFSSAGFTGTLTSTGTITVSGSATFGAGGTYSNTGTWTFNATSGTSNITTNAKSLSFSMTFNGVGGTWQLQDALTLGATNTVTLTNGSIDLNGKNLTCGILSSNNSNTRSILFGAGQIYLTGSAATIIGINAATGYTTSGTPIINCTYSGATGTRTIRFGSTGGPSESNVFSLNITAGTDILSMSSSSYKTVNYTGFAGSIAAYDITLYGGLTVSSGMTLGAATSRFTFAATSGNYNITTNAQTFDFPVTFNGIGGTWSFQDALTLGSTKTLTLSNGTVKFKNGTTNTAGIFAIAGTVSNQIVINSTTNGSKYTLSQASGTVNASYMTIKDSTATGGAGWDAFTTNGNIDSGNNTGWVFDPVPSDVNIEFPITLQSFTQPRRF